MSGVQGFLPEENLQKFVIRTRSRTSSADGLSLDSALDEVRAFLRTYNQEFSKTLGPQGWRPTSAVVDQFVQSLSGLLPETPTHWGLFFPNPRWSEISGSFLKTLVDFLNSKGHLCAFPRINHQGHMEFAQCSYEESQIDPNFKMASAPPTAPVSLPEYFLVPGTAADKKGHRLGRGRGHYDFYFQKRFGSKLEPKKRDFWCCAVIHSNNVVEEFPSTWIQNHDVQMDAILADSFYLVRE